MKYSNLFFTALLGFNSFFQAAVIDQGNTFVTVKTSKSDLTAFNVTLVRTDKLLYDDNLLAMRSVSLLFEFHIKDNKLHYQNESIPAIGEKPKVTTVKAIAVPKGVDPAIVDSLFSQGLVGVEITSNVENVLVASSKGPYAPMIFGHHITLHEKILEIDGNKIRSSDIYEHVIDLDRDGKVIRIVSDPILARQVVISPSIDSQDPAGLSSCDDAFFESVDVSDFLFQLFVFIFSILLGISVIKLALLARAVYTRRRQADYASVSVSDLPPSYEVKDAVIFSTDFAVTENSALVESSETESEVTALKVLSIEDETEL